MAEAIADANRRLQRQSLSNKVTNLMKVVMVSGGDPRETMEVLDIPEEKATINAQDENGMTALMHAVKKEFVDVGRKLIEAGADITLRNKDQKTVGDLLSEIPDAELSSDPVKVQELRVEFSKKGGKKSRRRKTQRKKTYRRRRRPAV